MQRNELHIGQHVRINGPCVQFVNGRRTIGVDTREGTVARLPPPDLFVGTIGFPSKAAIDVDGHWVFARPDELEPTGDSV